MRRGVAMAGVLTALLVAAPVAAAKTITAHHGRVSAAVTIKGQAPAPAQRLTITRAGKVAYDKPVTSKFCFASCITGRGSLHVLDLEHNGRPDVVLELFTGGAHCCSVDQIFSWDPRTKAYVETQRNFGDPGALIVDLGHNHRYELRTADDSFAYEFTAYAFSGLPIEILTFSHRHFTNVTRRYPSLIARDAAVWLKAYKSTAPSYQGSTGLIAAWAADEDLLGNSSMVSSYLSQEANAGHLKSGEGNVLPSGTKFVAKLQRFLRAHGYLH